MSGRRQCKDCPPESKREAKYPGPRCFSHNRVVVKVRKAAQHDAAVSRTYGVSRGFYAELREAQNGRCAICQVATGATKRLALDHNHATGEPRGLLCGPCNRVVGLFRDDPERFKRAARYLETPPAAALLIADEGEAS